MKKLQIALLGIALTMGIFGAFANSHTAMPVHNSTDPQYDVQDAAGGPILFTGTAAEVMAWEYSHYPLCNGGPISCTKVYNAGTATEEILLEVFRN